MYLFQLRGLLLGLLLIINAPLAMADQLNGVIYSDSELELAMGLNAPISQIFVREGDVVEKGQLLLILDDKIQKLEERRRFIIWQDDSEIQSLVQRRQIVENRLDIAKKLYESSRSISKDDLDVLQLELLQLTGRIDQLNAQKLREEVEHNISLQEVEMRRLYAPISGVITKSPLKVGEWVKAGEPVIQLVDIQNLNVKFNVPARLIERLPVGLTMMVNIDNTFFKGYVKSISPVADPASGLIEIKVSLKNDDLKIRPGSKASIQLSTTL